MKEQAKKPEFVYQLKITLVDSKPPIWRRFLVDPDVKLPDLHKIVQTVMGWTNSHLHHFIAGKQLYSLPDGNDFVQSVDYRKIRLSDLVQREKQSIHYEYDFGDGWAHKIVLEKILPGDDTVKYPICIAGNGSCPPEDCGGIWGYGNLLLILADPQHEEHKEMKEWIGGDFDPEAFDMTKTNALLRKRSFGCPAM